MSSYSELFEQSFQNAISLTGNNSRISTWCQPEKGACPCPNCIEKNRFRDDVYVVIQGHTAYIGEILESYRGYKNIVWAMDDTCSLRDYGLVHGTRINPVVVKRPVNSGFGNINLQVISTVEGLKYAKELGAKYCIKIRSDMVMNPLDKFINSCDFSTLGFLAYVSNPYNNFDKPFEPINKFISSFTRFYDIKEHNITRNYVTDHCLTGPVDDLILFFDNAEDPDNASATTIQAPAEFKFLLNYLRRSKYKLDTSSEYLKKNFNFFLSILEEKGIDLISIKNNYDNYSNLRELQNMFSES